MRFLEEREFERVGGNKTFKVDVRIVAATHRDLKKKLEDGTFREDLYYRLNVIEIHIPPMRERPGDIPLLAHHFLRKYAEANSKDIRGIGDDVMALLLSHPWPGNVRELENAMERAVVLSDGTELHPAHFPTLRRAAGDEAGRAPAQASSLGVRIPGSPLADLEREAILRTLEAVGGSTSKAAAILDISARKIQYKLKEYQQQGRPDAATGRHGHHQVNGNEKRGEPGEGGELGERSRTEPFGGLSAPRAPAEISARGAVSRAGPPKRAVSVCRGPSAWSGGCSPVSRNSRWARIATGPGLPLIRECSTAPRQNTSVGTYAR